MIWYVTDAVGSAVWGIAAASWVWARALRRLTLRLLARVDEAETAHRLERRRDTYDYGRQYEVRPQAGKPATVYNLLPVRRNNLGQ